MRRQEELYLLLAVKSLSQNRRDKRYLLKISSLDHERICEVENVFEHGYEYVYKLWPCLQSEREFVRIEMLERVGEELVKRGEASPMVRYSQEGDRYQFAASRKEQCVLILKFRASTLSEVEKRLSNRELEKLNDQVQLELIKNKHENQNYHSYLEYTNRFLDFLDNSKYLDAAEVDEDKKSIKSNDKIQQASKSRSESSFLLGDFNTRMRESLQFLSNGKYFQNSPTSVTAADKKHHLPNIEEDHRLENANESVQSKANGIRRQNSQKISTEIRKRRNLYTLKQQDSIEASKQQISASESKIKQIEPVSFQTIPNNQEEEIRKEVQSPIIRTNDFPLKQIKIEMETSRRNARRRKNAQSQNKQIKDSYSSALKKLEDVDLNKVFDQPHRKEKEKIEVQEVKIEMYEMKLHLFRGDFEHPKKLVVSYGKTKYQTLPANLKNKEAEWSNHLIIPKCSTSAHLHCKILSVSEFSFFEEGEAKVLINDFIRCQTETVKLYLNCSSIVIGFIEFRYKVSPFAANQDSAKEASTLVIDRKERKSISLPQISRPNKAQFRYKEIGSKQGRSGAVSSLRKSKSRKSRPQLERYTTSPDYQSMQFTRSRKDKRALLSRVKQKKLKMKAKIH